MSDQEELAALRRMAELEDRAKKPPAAPEKSPFDNAMYDNPITGLAELGLQGVTGLGTLASKGLTGAMGMLAHGRAGMKQTAQEIDAAPDFTYEPMTTSAKAVNKGLSKVMDALHSVAMARAEGPSNVNGESPAALRLGYHMPVSESPEASADMGAVTELLPQALAAISPARGVGRAAGAALKAPVDYFSPSVQAGNVIRAVAGTPEQRAAQAAALRSAPAPLAATIPNSGVTAAQAVMNVPEGTTVQALQRAVAQSPDKGISVDFAKRIAQQKAAMDAARGVLDQKTEPLRTKALADAAAGGIRASDLLDALPNDKSPIVAGTPVVKRSLDATRKFITENTDPVTGTINPETLYQFRKTGLGQVVADSAGQDLDALKYTKLHFARGVQTAIDDSIVKAGGTDWPKYLKTYSEGVKPIQALEDSLTEMYSPEQKTALGGDTGIKSGVGAPHLISKAASLTNYGLGLRRALMGKSVNRHIANAMLDPTSLADILAGPVPKSALPAALAARPPLELKPSPGRAYEPHQPQLLRPDASGVTAAESSQVPQENVRLAPPPGTAFEPNQASLPLSEPLAPPTPPAAGPSGEQMPLPLRVAKPAETLPPIPTSATRAASKAELQHMLQVLERLRDEQP